MLEVYIVQLLLYSIYVIIEINRYKTRFCVFFYLFCIICAHSYFAIILKRKRKLVALLLLPYRYFVTVNVLWLFLAVPWVGLQFVIVVFPDHILLLLMIFYLPQWVESKMCTPQSCG